jgi:hypothetical protein
MDDTLVRDALREHASVAEPPLGLTTAGLLAAGRRSRRQHIAWRAGVAATVAAAAAVVSPIVLAGGQPTNPLDHPQVLPPVELGAGPACAVTRPRPEHAVDPANGMAMTPETVEWARYAITCHLRDVLPHLVPPSAVLDPPRPEAVAHGIPTTATSLAPGETEGPEGSGPEPYATGQFMVDAFITDEAGTGSFSFSLSVLDPAYDERTYAERSCRESPEECTVWETTDGALVLARQSVEPDTGYVINLVEVFTEKMFIYANSTNVGLTDEGRSQSPPPTGGVHSEISRDRPPLRLNQLVEIATAPDLRLFR